MLFKIYSENTAYKDVLKVARILEDGGLVIIPTDSVYAIACDSRKPKAIDKIARIKGVKPEKAEFSFIFDSLSTVAEYTKPFHNDIFKLMKRNLPGPFTFILEANNKVPKIFKNNKKTLGVRIPDNKITLQIVSALKSPLMVTSVHDEDDVIEYTTDPSLIHEKYDLLVDMVIDGGYGNNEASTVVDCTGVGIEIIRQGEMELII
jgi:tRNA threonylcarbamoyl adenosine modification protein (Sua5/YciO/YrdC/YwlC family)